MKKKTSCLCLLGLLRKTSGGEYVIDLITVFFYIIPLKVSFAYKFRSKTKKRPGFQTIIAINQMEVYSLLNGTYLLMDYVKGSV